MTKKIIATFLCIILIVTLFPIGIISNAVSDDFTISITANNSTYHRGDTITYTIKIKQTGTLTAYGFNLNVPSSLTYIENTENSSATATLGFTGQGEGAGISVQKVNETQYYNFTGFGANSYKGTDEITLGTIKFKVNDNATYGDINLDVLKDDDLVANNESYGNKIININKSTVLLEQVKVPSTGVTILPLNSSVVAGKTVQLTATLAPNNSTDSVTWTSKDENVATVDSNGLVKGITKGDTKIVATTTSGKTAECSLSVSCNHSTTTKHEAVVSTCIQKGHAEYYTCDICGEIVSGSNEELPLADHSYGNWHAEVLPKHENQESLPGTKGYYQCSVCNKYFDKDYNEIKNLTIPAEEHKAQGDYKFDTKNHWKECACGIIMNTEAHKPSDTVKENVILATCTTDGSHEDVTYCSICGYEISRVKVVDKALGHTKGEMKTENVKAPTCEADGSHDEVYYCKKCNEEISRTTVTDKALGHKSSEVVKENVIPSTHLLEGSYDEVVYCSVCHKELSRVHKTTPVIPHSPKDESWENDENQHWQICGCGVKINIANHNPSEAVKENIKTPTCTEDGSHDEVVYCSVCHRELSRKNIIDVALGHKEEDKVKENIKAPTCTKDGSHDEVIYCSVCNKELSRTKVVDKALEHIGGKATCVKKAICTRCGEEYGELDKDNHTGNVEVKNAKEPTFTEEGYTGDKYCKDCGILLEKGTKIDKFVYKMLEGMDGEHEEKTKDSLTFRANGKLENLNTVYVDETKLTENVDYTAKSGSTIITLSHEYLNKLDVGTHTLKMNYNDGGFVTTEFKIAEVKNEEKNTNVTTNKTTITPKTSDESSMTLWIVGTILSGICLLGIIKWNIRRNKKSSKHLK